jgi:exopolyphosphatase/pppGpp-phosphohydrolase
MEWERNLMGLIARYQRKKIPSEDSKDCKRLSKKHLNNLVFLSGVLRLATSLDRSRQSKIAGIKVVCNDDQIDLHLTLAKDRKGMVELHKATLEKANIEASLGKEINFIVEKQAT